MYKRLCFIACLIMGVSTSMASAQLKSPLELGSIDWKMQTLQATGTGALSKTGDFVNQRLIGRRSATLNAYKELIKSGKAIQLRPSLTLRDYIKAHPQAPSKFKSLVKGVKRQGIPRYFADGSVEVDLKIPLFGIQGIARLLNPVDLLKEPLMFPKDLSTSASESHSGLIIQAQGLGLKPALFPLIFTQKGRLYPRILPSVLEKSTVSYALSLDEAKKMTALIGKFPLVIKAQKAMGSPIATDILLDNQVALNVAQANSVSPFLDAFKVVVIL